MINYSITARAVNNNLFEINQAKARIAQAKAEGKTPDTKDEALVESVVTNYFATAQYTEVTPYSGAVPEDSKEPRNP